MLTRTSQRHPHAGALKSNSTLASGEQRGQQEMKLSLDTSHSLSWDSQDSSSFSTL